jgi:magnesium and cobalt exporter, CNNM family
MDPKHSEHPAMLLVEIAIIVVLILANGVLALAELAIVSSRRSRLETLARDGVGGARSALGLIDDPGRFLSTVQTGITLVGILAGAFGSATIARPMGTALDRIAWIAPNGDSVAIAIVVVVIAYLSLVIGELVPKQIAFADPERSAVIMAPSMHLLSRLASPVVWILQHSSRAVLRLSGLPARRRTTITEEEVRALIAAGTGAGVFAPQEKAMIDGVLRLADRSVRVIMTLRSEIVWIDRTAGRAEIVETVEAGRHTRLLVCDGSVDHPVGVVDARDILTRALKGEPLDLALIAKDALVITERTPVLRLIDLFRKEGVHFALIVDEYGTTQGIVTATDVLESIAGDLPERGDAVEAMAVRRADGSWLIDGLMPIDEFEDLVGIGGLASGGDFETVAGFVVSELGRLPETGDRVVRPDMTIEVVDMDGRRIDKLAVTLPQHHP